MCFPEGIFHKVVSEGCFMDQESQVLRVVFYCLADSCVSWIEDVAVLSRLDETRIWFDAVICFYAKYSVDAHAFLKYTEHLLDIVLDDNFLD